MLNCRWYDDSGSYIPFEERDPKGAIGTALQEHSEVVEYTQVASYIHIFVTDSVSERDLKEYMDMCIDNATFSFVKEHNHTYRYIEGDRVIKLKMV